MLIKPAPIFVEDIIGEDASDWRDGVDCAPRGVNALPLAHGWVRGEQTQPGFSAYATDYSALEDYAVRCGTPPGFYLEVNLGTPQSGTIGRQTWELPTGGLYVLNVQESLRWKNRRVAGTEHQRCGIEIDHEWFETGQHETLHVSQFQIRELLSSHAKPLKALASKSVNSVARRMTACMNAVGSVGKLRREAIGLELLLEALAIFSGSNGRTNGRLSRRDLNRIANVREILDGLGPDEEVSLANLARQAGLSVSTMTRHFRSSFGTSVCDYLADVRMQRACRALEQGEVTIDVAAYIAGFSHTANFTRAFRRRFGRTPGTVGPKRR